LGVQCVRLVARGRFATEKAERIGIFGKCVALMNRIILFFFTFISGLSLAQNDDFMEGYVVTKRGDTLRGKIKDRNQITDSIPWPKVKFMGEDGRIKRLGSKKVSAYYNGNVICRSITAYNNRSVFAEVVEQGEVIMYKVYESVITGVGYSNVGGSSSSMYPQNTDPVYRKDLYVQKRNNPRSLMRVPKLTFGSAMSRFFEDDPEIKGQVEKKELVFKDVQAIVRLYNSRHSGQ